MLFRLLPLPLKIWISANTCQVLLPHAGNQDSTSARIFTVFAKLFINSDYLTSLEAFTVLEESFPNATDQDRMDCIRYLRQSEHLVIDDKLALFRELRKVIESEL